jgi:hypothetical protein
MDATLALITSHVEGCARARLHVERTQTDTGISDEEWWLKTEPVLARVLDPASFPVATRVGTATGEAFQSASNPEFALNFGLERILAGVAALIAEKGATSVPRPKPIT